MHFSHVNDFGTLAKAITQVENALPGYEQTLLTLNPRTIPVIGFTGPPGAGKSTLLNATVASLLSQNKKLGLLLVDPSSPFNFGALLGDRLRLTAHFNNPNLFIRSLASRGSLGGLSDTIVEVLEVMKSHPFDYIFIETVGVGQSEVEIAGLADKTVVVLVPEAGDSVQTMKAGIMEIADVFVINKSDRPEAEALLQALINQLHLAGRETIPVIKTVAVEGIGVDNLIETFSQQSQINRKRKLSLLLNKTLRIIQKIRMQDIDTSFIASALEEESKHEGFSLYRFVKKIIETPATMKKS
ncbi:MAG: GTP-binding protein [Chitinophagales bacterium]|nr:methylmalonyl Co-A mutase-associated GTPase MeaB [Chitinophagales bacterium]MDW8274148.1 GTP-binding protein [Chitinophagales bacterium]